MFFTLPSSEICETIDLLDYFATGLRSSSYVTDFPPISKTRTPKLHHEMFRALLEGSRKIGVGPVKRVLREKSCTSIRRTRFEKIRWFFFC